MACWKSCTQKSCTQKSYTQKSCTQTLSHFQLTLNFFCFSLRGSFLFLQTRTGTCAWWRTWSLTLPNIVRLTEPKPRVPVIIKSTFSSSATRSISVLADPVVFFTSPWSYNYTTTVACVTQYATITSLKLALHFINLNKIYTLIKSMTHI